MKQPNDTQVKTAKHKGILKWLLAAIVLVIIVFFGFTFQVKEGEYAIVTRFGAVRSEITKAGLYLKLPWPFENTAIFDGKKQYLDSGYLETLTKDKKNVILQTYVVWSIEDPTKFYTKVETTEKAQKYLNDLLTNEKNSLLGNYELSALVNLNEEEIKLPEIQTALSQNANEHALSQYGIRIHEVNMKRLGLPKDNIDSVFSQMEAERKISADKLTAEGERDAAIIKSNADTEAAQIKAEGREEAAKINAETEKLVAKIYADAHTQDPELYKFLKKLIALENSVDENTVIITSKDDAPFDALNGLE